MFLLTPSTEAEKKKIVSGLLSRQKERMTLKKGEVHVLDYKNNLNPQTSFFFFFALLVLSYKLSLPKKSSFCLFSVYFLLSHTLFFQ